MHSSDIYIGRLHFQCKGVRFCLDIFVGKRLTNLQNTGDPDQISHYVASDLDLHYLPISLYGFPV